MKVRFVLLLIPAMLLCANVAYANWPCEQRHHPKKHRVVHHHKHHKHYTRHCTYVYGRAEPVCVYRYYPQAEFPAFRSGAPTGRGHYVNLYDCTPYDPDMSTGDDDPTVYPGMNINN